MTRWTDFGRALNRSLAFLGQIFVMKLRQKVPTSRAGPRGWILKWGGVLNCRGGTRVQANMCFILLLTASSSYRGFSWSTDPSMHCRELGYWSSSPDGIWTLHWSGPATSAAAWKLCEGAIGVGAVLRWWYMQKEKHPQRNCPWTVEKGNASAFLLLL